jgi:hypothetical protein
LIFSGEVGALYPSKSGLSHKHIVKDIGKGKVMESEKQGDSSAVPDGCCRPLEGVDGSRAHSGAGGQNVGDGWTWNAEVERYVLWFEGAWYTYNAESQAVEAWAEDAGSATTAAGGGERRMGGQESSSSCSSSSSGSSSSDEDEDNAQNSNHRGDSAPRDAETMMRMSGDGGGGQGGGRRGESESGEEGVEGGGGEGGANFYEASELGEGGDHPEPIVSGEWVFDGEFWCHPDGYSYHPGLNQYFRGGERVQHLGDIQGPDPEVLREKWLQDR